jgi:hypothetical protein
MRVIRGRIKISMDKEAYGFGLKPFLVPDLLERGCVQILPVEYRIL